MTLIQKTLFATLFAAAVGIGFHEARQSARLREQTRALLLQQESLTAQNERLQQERDEAARRLAAINQGNSQSREDQSSLLKLRAESARLREDSRELAQLKASAVAKGIDPAESELKSWLGRVNKLKEKLAQTPGQRIPELQFLTDQDWFEVVKDGKHIDAEGGSSQALTALRTAAKNQFADLLQAALRNYAQAANGQPLTDLSQLKSYFASPIDDSVLQRYEIKQPGTLTEKSTPLGDLDDKYFEISMNTINVSSVAENALQGAVQAYTAANNGQNPTDPAQLQPFIKTPAEQAALQKMMQTAGTK